jgi:hypothetical protein
VKDAIITQSIKRILTPILLRLLFRIPRIAQERLPQAVTYGALALIPDLLGDKIAVASKGALEALNPIEDVHPHRVCGVPQSHSKATRSHLL